MSEWLRGIWFGDTLRLAGARDAQADGQNTQYEKRPFHGDILSTENETRISYRFGCDDKTRLDTFVRCDFSLF